MQLTVPSFEFPRDIPPSVHFVGTLPIIPNQAPLPSWAHELDGSRKVVLVTQGTVANHNFGLLIAPTLAALANEPDLLVVATAGGRPIDAIPGPIPGNARLASYLPFEWVLPKVDVFVTNGGYGSVNQAMSFGIPLVTAGLTEDKADVNARVAWSGVGIDLATNEPTPQALREAIRTVLDKPNYRSRASLMADEFAGIDTRSEILRIVSQVSQSSDEDGLRLRDVAGRQEHSGVLERQSPCPDRLSGVTRHHGGAPPSGMLDANRGFRRIWARWIAQPWDIQLVLLFEAEAVIRRGLPCNPTKRGAECARPTETDLERDLGNGCTRFASKVFARSIRRAVQ